MAFSITKNLKGDLFGGVTAGIVALLLALAFGIQAFGGIDSPSVASIGALAGLTGAIMVGFFAALTGGTPSQISGLYTTDRHVKDYDIILLEGYPVMGVEMEWQP